jgi:hypothetical protein
LCGRTGRGASLRGLIRCTEAVEAEQRDANRTSSGFCSFRWSRSCYSLAVTVDSLQLEKVSQSLLSLSLSLYIVLHLPRARGAAPPHSRATSGSSSPALISTRKERGASDLHEIVSRCRYGRRRERASVWPSNSTASQLDGALCPRSPFASLFLQQCRKVTTLNIITPTAILHPPTFLHLLMATPSPTPSQEGTNNPTRPSRSPTIQRCRTSPLDP